MVNGYVFTIEDDDQVTNNLVNDSSDSDSEVEVPLQDEETVTAQTLRIKMAKRAKKRADALENSFDLFSKEAEANKEDFKFSSTVEMIRNDSRQSDLNRVKVGDIISKKLESAETSEKLDEILNRETTSNEEGEGSSSTPGSVREIVPRHPDKIPQEWRQCDTASYEVMSFEELNISRPLLKSIRNLGFQSPTPVQASVIPEALSGNDVLVSAVTGSGKTAAFLLPIMERLLYKPKGVNLSRVLIMCPTRELAAQCYEVATSFAGTADIKSVLVVGGLSEQRQAVALRQRPDIIIGTPGRILDHLINTASVHVEDVEILVLDEADRLLEMGFIEEVKEIVNLCPKGRQTMMFSATLSDQVGELAKESLRSPKKIAVDPLFSLAHNLSQEFIRVRTHHDEDDKRAALVVSLCMRTFKEKVIVFFPSKRLAHRMRIIFGLLKMNATELHGDLTQVQRLEALELFRAGKVDILLCTDLASRGLDIKGVKTVINYSLPNQLAQYVHRVGRTARAGQKGHAVSLVGDDNHQMLAEIVKRAPTQVKRRKLPQSVIDETCEKVLSLQKTVEEILAEERVERAARIAEMEAQKSENMIVHRDEILSRPAKQWFQTEQDKKEVKETSKELAQRTRLEEKAKLEKSQRIHEQNVTDRAKRTTKKEAKKAQEELKKIENLMLVTTGAKRYSAHSHDPDAFDYRYKDVEVPEMEEWDPAKAEKKRVKKQRGNFKSKKRYKRRK